MSSNITTARGDILNLDDLIMKASRPFGFKDKKSEIAKVEPAKKAALNVRGNMPSAPTGPAPQLSDSATKALRDVTVKEGVVAPVSVADKLRPTKSMAELTGVTIKDPKTIKVRDGAKVNPGDGAAFAENTALAEIEEHLQVAHPKATDAAVNYENRREQLNKRRKAGRLSQEEALEAEAEDSD